MRNISVLKDLHRVCRTVSDGIRHFVANWRPKPRIWAFQVTAFTGTIPALDITEALVDIPDATMDYENLVKFVIVNEV